MTKTINWSKLENDLSDWLSTFSSEWIRFRNPNQALPGLTSDGFRSDGCLTDGKVLIAIEVEVRQTHPDTNVGKYWLLQESSPYERIILFHIYTPHFDSYEWRKKLGEFYSNKMEREIPIEYIQLDFRNATSYDRTLGRIKKKIRAKIKKEFEEQSCTII